MNDIPGWIEGLPVHEMLCERPNPTCEGYVLVFFWCKHCKRLHQHGSRRIKHEAFMARSAHCSRKLPYSNYQLHRVPWQKAHTQDGITAPVLDVVGWQHNGRAIVICPKCCKKHRHWIMEGEEYTLVDGRCYPRYFVRQEIEV